MPRTHRAPLHEVPTRPLFAESVDIEEVDVIREDGETFVVIRWCHRWPVAWLTSRTSESPVQYAYGPCVATEFHVCTDLDLVVPCGPPVPRHVESVLIAHIAGMFPDPALQTEAA